MSGNSAPPPAAAETPSESTATHSPPQDPQSEELKKEYERMRKEAEELMALIGLDVKSGKPIDRGSRCISGINSLSGFRPEYSSIPSPSIYLPLRGAQSRSRFQ